MFGGLDVSDNEGRYVGEALLVYIYRALDKPNKSAYFHVALLDILIKNVRDSLQLYFGISWAKGTSCLKSFDRRSNLDEHPNAPEWLVAHMVTTGAVFAQLSDDAIKRITEMTREKRRQLEALAAAIFPDHQSISNRARLFENARLDKPKYLVAEENQRKDRKEVATVIQRQINPALAELEECLNAAFSDPELTPQDRDKLEKDLEDILIGRLELEQPQISTELIARTMMRGLKKLGDWAASGIVGDLAVKVAGKVAAAILLGFPFLS